jgi:hypothetical protein
VSLIGGEKVPSIYGEKVSRREGNAPKRASLSDGREVKFAVIRRSRICT